MKKKLPRFLYGYLSSSVETINMSLPWTPSDRDGLFKMNRVPEDAEEDNLILWAHTNKGDRVYDCEFGLDAHRHIFDPQTLTREVLERNGSAQLKKYFPYLIIEEFKVLAKEQDDSLDLNSLKIILIARLKNGSKTIEIAEVISP